MGVRLLENRKDSLGEIAGQQAGNPITGGPLVRRHRPECPQRIIQAVDVENAQYRDRRVVVCLVAKRTDEVRVAALACFVPTQ
jgi:hypothetical protein